MTTTNEREDLAEVIRAIDGPATIGGLDVADAILAAGWRKPRTVTTAAELDALPVGSVVLDKTGDPWVKTDVDYWQVYQEFNDGAGLLLCSPLTLIHEGAA